MFDGSPEELNHLMTSATVTDSNLEVVIEALKSHNYRVAIDKATEAINQIEESEVTKKHLAHALCRLYYARATAYRFSYTVVSGNTDEKLLETALRDTEQVLECSTLLSPEQEKDVSDIIEKLPNERDDIKKELLAHRSMRKTTSHSNESLERKSETQTDQKAQSKKWYRQMWFLVLTFLFVTPVWSIIILTDHEQGKITKIFAGFFLLASILWILVMLTG